MPYVREHELQLFRDRLKVGFVNYSSGLLDILVVLYLVLKSRNCLWRQLVFHVLVHLVDFTLFSIGVMTFRVESHWASSVRCDVFLCSYPVPAADYLFSNEYINHLITFPFDFRHEELLAYYIIFLRYHKWKSTFYCHLHSGSADSCIIVGMISCCQLEQLAICELWVPLH